MTNPYQAPQSEVQIDSASTTGNLEPVRSGQRQLILGLILNIVATGQNQATPEGPALMMIFGIIALIFSLIGLVKVGRGLKMKRWGIALVALLSIIPLLNLIVLFIMNTRATKALRAGGYKVGFLGAAKPKAA